MSDDLPIFEYFPNPRDNGCIKKTNVTCPCCQRLRGFIYIGPIYSQADVQKVCPWCIDDGSAAAKWDASFNDTYSVPDTVPPNIVDIIAHRTPGYSTWQGNQWVFSRNDALVFLGEVNGSKLLKEGNTEKIAACMTALAEWGITDEGHLVTVTPGDQPAIYLFEDRQTGEFEAYADMT